ncbi:hypothetical protein LZ30DRAFT_720340 [Colletotrichum cereale]|nr:hypothetical protein LZ30DRAFT_720340 [Colletotrichum cereale]
MPSAKAKEAFDTKAASGRPQKQQDAINLADRIFHLDNGVIWGKTARDEIKGHLTKTMTANTLAVTNNPSYRNVGNALTAGTAIPENETWALVFRARGDVTGLWKDKPNRKIIRVMGNVVKQLDNHRLPADEDVNYLRGYANISRLKQALKSAEQAQDDENAEDGEDGENDEDSEDGDDDEDGEDTEENNEDVRKKGKNAKGSVAALKPGSKISTKMPTVKRAGQPNEKGKSSKQAKKGNTRTKDVSDDEDADVPAVEKESVSDGRASSFAITNLFSNKKTSDIAKQKNVLGKRTFTAKEKHQQLNRMSAAVEGDDPTSTQQATMMWVLKLMQDNGVDVAEGYKDFIEKWKKM